MSNTKVFSTEISDDGAVLSGPFRSPKNMLAEQAYGGHASIHDDSTAQQLGFKSATIEGPTHFSQFVPLAHAVWGDRFLREGCLSVAYKTACHEDEQVQAFLAKPEGDGSYAEIWMVRSDGAEVLRGSATVGAKASALSAKFDALPAPDPLRVIHRDVSLGDRRERLTVRLGADDVMGSLYPFSLRQKLTAITEPSPVYLGDGDARFGGAIIPFEMVSVLLHHQAATDPWLGAEPTIDLFVDQEIRMIDGPLMVGADYEIEREVVGLSGSRRTESTWVRTQVFLPGGDTPIASMLLNVASFKESYPRYEELAAEVRAAAA